MAAMMENAPRRRLSRRRGTKLVPTYVCTRGPGDAAAGLVPIKEYVCTLARAGSPQRSRVKGERRTDVGWLAGWNQRHGERALSHHGMARGLSVAARGALFSPLPFYRQQHRAFLPLPLRSPATSSNVFARFAGATSTVRTHHLGSWRRPRR